MTTEINEWITEFDHGKNLMIHKMTERVSVISDIKVGIMKVYKDGVEIDSIKNPSIVEYGRLITKIYEAALDLEKFSNE